MTVLNVHTLLRQRIRWYQVNRDPVRKSSYVQQLRVLVTWQPSWGSRSCLRRYSTVEIWQKWPWSWRNGGENVEHRWMKHDVREHLHVAVGPRMFCSPHWTCRAHTTATWPTDRRGRSHQSRHQKLGSLWIDQM
jgi:hypothetical protein